MPWVKDDHKHNAVDNIGPHSDGNTTSGKTMSNASKAGKPVQELLIGLFAISDVCLEELQGGFLEEFLWNS